MIEHSIALRHMKKVDKVWGHEEWIENNNLYCGKILTLKKDYFCSIHYHQVKQETFYILKGKVKLELFGKTLIMKKGDVYTLEPLTVHRFTGLEDSNILEISTHHEDSDSYRVKIGGKC